MAFYFILFFPLTTHLIATVSFAEIQPKNLSVQAGELVELVQREKLPEFLQLIWMITPFGTNDSETIVTYNNERIDPRDSYKDRVVFSTTTFSLTLKNMQKTDSGLYCTTTIGNETKDFCQYNVFVVENHGSPTNIFLPWILLTSTISTIIMF